MITKKNPSVDVGRNSSLYFAIGLNVMLLFTWQAFEFKTFEKPTETIKIVSLPIDLQEDIPITKIDVALPPPPVAASEIIKVVESVTEIEETVIESTESSQETAITEPHEVIGVGDVVVDEVEEEVEVPFAVIENIPVFPGCEGLSHAKAKACFQAKMQAHIKAHFNYPEDALDLGVQGRVFVLFIINEKGNITGVKSRGPDKRLEKEAERIVSLLPKMRPGMQRGKPVKVSYAVPIYFKYEEGR